MYFVSASVMNIFAKAANKWFPSHTFEFAITLCTSVRNGLFKVSISAKEEGITFKLNIFLE